MFACRNKQPRQHIRLASWIGRAPAAVEDLAYIEHALDAARAWLRHGERRLEAFRKEINESRLSMLLRRQAS